MKQTINLHSFREAFKRMGRENQFSYEGLEALFDHLEILEQGAEEEYELDVIELCCNYSEYASLEDFHQDYSKDDYPDIETIKDSTEVIEIDDNAFIIQNF